MSTVTIIGAAPYPVTLSDGGQVFTGELREVELDDVVTSAIGTGMLNVVERPDLPSESSSTTTRSETTTSPRKSKAAPAADPEPTEGE